MLKAGDIKGVFTALITPFSDGEIDTASYTKLIDWQIEQGVHGLVAVGTTGESPTLSFDEHKSVVETAVNEAKGRVPVIAGTGANNTAEAIELTIHASNCGADAALVVVPYYNKPTQEGIYEHFKAIHDAAEIPLILYNVPSRTVVGISDETIERLAELPRVIAIKDATGDLARVSTLRNLVGDRLALISGEDMTVIGFNAMGGQGVISVTSNIAPAQCARIQNLTLEGSFTEALQEHEKLVPLHKAMFVETSPIPVKYAASILGYCRDELRLPLISARESTKKLIKQAMLDAGIL